MAEYTVIRTKRKTAGIYILPGGRVEVRCPLNFSDRAVEALVRRKEKWIEKHLQIVCARKKEPLIGGKILLWGGEYLIEAGSQAGFDGRAFTVLPGREAVCLSGIYQSLAEQTIPDRAIEIAQNIGIMPATIKISQARSYWGICTGKNEIRFSRRIVMLPADVIDYIIIHELAHCREHNHGPEFWRLVEKCLPDYLEKRRKLREFEKIILAQDWE